MAELPTLLSLLGDRDTLQGLGFLNVVQMT